MGGHIYPFLFAPWSYLPGFLSIWRILVDYLANQFSAETSILTPELLSALLSALMSALMSALLSALMSGLLSQRKAISCFDID